MTKIEQKVWFSDTEIRQGNSKTLKTIVSYLRRKNVKVYAYFEFSNSSVIIKYKGLICNFKNSSQACKYLYDIYLTLQEEDKGQLIKNKIMADNCYKIGV